MPHTWKQLHSPIASSYSITTTRRQQVRLTEREGRAIVGNYNRLQKHVTISVRAWGSFLPRAFAARPGWLYPCRSRRFAWPNVPPEGRPRRPEGARSCFLAREPFWSAASPPIGLVRRYAEE